MKIRIFKLPRIGKFDCPKNGIFPKGLTHAFGQKMPIFSLCVFGQNKIRNKVK